MNIPTQTNFVANEPAFIPPFTPAQGPTPPVVQLAGQAAVQEALADTDDLLDTEDLLEAPPAPNTIESLDTAQYEREFLGFSTGDSSEDDTYMNEEKEDKRNAKIARNIQKSLQKRYEAAEAIDSSEELQADAFFSIATNFSIKKDDFSYIMDIQRGTFLPLEAAKAMTIGNTTHYPRKQALAFYMIAMNPAVPAQFRYEAASQMDGGDEYDHAYRAQKMDAFQKLAEDATVATEYRIDSLRALKNDGIADHRLAPITELIAEGWDCQANTDEAWELFEDLYRLEGNVDKDEYNPYEDADEEQAPQKSIMHPLQLKIIDIILNKTHLNKDFRIRVVQEKLGGRAYQEQILENIGNGQAISLSMAEHNTKSASKMG